MSRLLRLLTPPVLRRYFRNLNERLRNLETAVDVLINSPRYTSSDAVGFNGQLIRKAIFRDVISAIPFHAIVETGTWIGDTTGVLAEMSLLPVYTCEINPRFHAIAKMRLAGVPRIHFALSDSRTLLGKLAGTELSEKPVMFYLDAHWYADLPLREEIELIASNWRRFVIMVDDFQVPEDDGYEYDTYSGGRVLSIGYIRDLLRRYKLIALFPAASSQGETGARRGCVVLAGVDVYGAELSRLTCLRRSAGV